MARPIGTPSREPRYFSADEDDIIRRMWPTQVSSTEIGKAMNPSVHGSAIRTRAKRIGLPNRSDVHNGHPMPAVVDKPARAEKPARKARAAARSGQLPREMPFAQKQAILSSRAVARRRLEDVQSSRAEQQRLVASDNSAIRCFCGAPGSPVLCTDHAQHLKQIHMRWVLVHA